MIKIKYLQSLLVFTLISLNILGQTVGIGEVTSIESKVLSYQSNKIKIAQYKEELLSLEALWRDKIAKQKDELAAIYKERDDLIADMKVGAKCSQCSKYKSEFEKEGKSFEQHLGEVKGYAVPATTDELEATRKKFTEKIALKKVQIQNLEKGDNAVNKKQNEISNLETANEKLCNEITNHSKEYENKVFAEAKTKHDYWLSDLMSLASNILIADDKITIYKARLIRYDQEFKKESEVIRELVKKENSETQDKKNALIESNLQQIKEIEIARTNYLTPLESDLTELKKRKYDLEKELIRLVPSDSSTKQLTASLNNLISQINSLDKKIEDYNTNVKSIILSLENECGKLKDEVFQLSVDLPKQQDIEISKIKPIYDNKKLEANKSLTKATNELVDARNLYSQKAKFYKEQNQLYLELVVSENDRMVLGGQKINCPIWNEVRFQITTNWNQAFPCVNALTTMAKPYSSNVFNSYCPGKSVASHLSAYKSFLVSLDEDDINAVKENSNISWFEEITK
jgi:hypothetical protein